MSWCWSLLLFPDTCTSHSQLEGTLAPGVGDVANLLVDLNLEVDGLGDHVLHSASLAHGMLDEVGLPAFSHVNAGKKKGKKCPRIKGRRLWNSALIHLLVPALTFERNIQIQYVIFLSAQLQFSWFVWHHFIQMSLQHLICQCWSSTTLVQSEIFPQTWDVLPWKHI